MVVERRLLCFCNKFQTLMNWRLELDNTFTTHMYFQYVLKTIFYHHTKTLIVGVYCLKGFSIIRLFLCPNYFISVCTHEMIIRKVKKL